MPRTFLLPRFEHLVAEPQLASLAVLETAAAIAVLALGAEYPELGCCDVDLREPPELVAAVDIIKAARGVDRNIARYRIALAERHARERQEDELVPF
jgi:hypothetical protein